MSEYACFCQINPLHAQQGRRAAQMAATLALDPRTVASWLTQERFRPRKATPRARIRDPFQAQIVRMLEKYPSSAAQGFDGGSSLVKASVRTVRPTRQAAFLTRALAPGAGAQVDGGAFGAVNVGQTSRRRSFFVLVLCSSRLMSVACTVSQTREPFLACHQNAFEYFGAVPHQGMVDNLTSAVLRRARGATPVLNPTSAACAAHYGLRLVPGHVGKGHEQGRVENGVGSVTKPCLAGLASADCSVLPPAAKQWLSSVANIRVHGETRQQPAARWHMAKPSLSPWPRPPFALATVSPGRAARQLRLTRATNRSAVPAHLAGQGLTLQTSPDRRGLDQGEQLIARHGRSYDRYGAGENPDHPKPRLEQRKKARDQQRCRRFLARSPQAEASARQRAPRRCTPPHHVRKIVALRDIYGAEAVARAMADALVYAAFAADSIANRLEQRARFTPEASALHLTRREARLAGALQPPDLSISHVAPPPQTHQG
jgi:transposase